MLSFSAYQTPRNAVAQKYKKGPINKQGECLKLLSAEIRSCPHGVDEYMLLNPGRVPQHLRRQHHECKLVVCVSEAPGVDASS